ncbi:hypothetical protein [Spiroplasma diminutum]|uniref:Transmembrane protein n=1 Tax=Spiroplasma diminutum CUAS-1 TaxID=1276221 RepID=S5M2C2_9MOLU|nr:hypothetical protein [Spiroplasma diminutum]AGR42212.1 hypothetical protein SDIMI_v3c05080 [Spiroplasma diminutum CUAS-1]
MNILIITFIFLVVATINWIAATLIYKKFEGKLRGKNWIIGIVGLVFFISISWILAIFMSLIFLMIFMAIYLPWWLNYMYYLLKQNKIRERIL